MAFRIVVHNPGSDKMGASFRSLMDLLARFARLPTGEKVIIDLTNLSFIHPFLILPLCTLIFNVKDKNEIVEIQSSNSIKSYLHTIFFPVGFDVLSSNNWRDDLGQFKNKTYLPICQIPVSKETGRDREELLTTFENILLHQLNISGTMVTVIKYLISEAIDNITEHADVPHGWIMVQNYPAKEFLDVCIVDSGIGLLGSYKKSFMDDIGDDASALQYAIKHCEQMAWNNVGFTNS